MNRMEVANSILNNSIEIHAFELGLQLAVLMLIIRFYTSKNFAGRATSVLIILVFFFDPIREISIKPWYFLMGFILTIGLSEVIINFPSLTYLRKKFSFLIPISRDSNSES